MNKHCPRCDQDKDLSEFTFDTTSLDGRNVYCRPCVKARRGTGKLGRPRKVDYTCARCPETRHSEFGVWNGRPSYLCRQCTRNDQNQRNAAKRKACKLAVPPPRELVIQAIRRGAKTQREIRIATRLPEDQVCDLLADLYDAGKLDRAAIRRREYRIRIAA